MKLFKCTRGNILPISFVYMTARHICCYHPRMFMSLLYFKYFYYIVSCTYKYYVTEVFILFLFNQEMSHRIFFVARPLRRKKRWRACVRIISNLLPTYSPYMWRNIFSETLVKKTRYLQKSCHLIIWYYIS